MSEENKNITTSSMAAVKAFTQSCIKGNENYIGENIGNADAEIELKPKQLNLIEDELLFFKKVPDTVYCAVELKEKSEINNAFLQTLQKLFADVVSTQLEYSNKFNRWVFITTFRFITSEQFDAIQDNSEDELYRAIDSTFDPTEKKTSSIAENLLSLTSVQNTPVSDASRYASLSKNAKELLYNFMYFGNTKKKWVKDFNYTISNVTNTAFNGAKYNNIIGTLYLDAEKVLNFLGSTKENHNKFVFSIKPKTNKVNNMDLLMEVYRYSVLQRKKYSAKYGIQFID